MCEFTSLDRCAAYAAARTALDAIETVADSWPIDLAARTRRAANDTVQLITTAVAHDQRSLDRRRCLRAAIASAMRAADCVDDAQAIGFTGSGVARAQRFTHRSVAVLGLFHASTAPLPGEIR